MVKVIKTLKFMDVSLKRRDGGPLHRQLSERFKSAILDGSLEPGTRLASSRGLASQLGTSRGTVELAYATLASEGYIETRGAAGTIVARSLARQRPVPRGRRSAPARI